MNLFLYLIGFGVFFGSLFLVWKRNSIRWSRLAASYPNIVAPRIAEKKFQQLILVGGGIAFNSYKGTVNLAANEHGVSIRLMPPFSMFHDPILIPFDEIEIVPTYWYINCESYKIRTTRVPEIEIVIDNELNAWIVEQSNALSVVPQKS